MPPQDPRQQQPTFPIPVAPTPRAPGQSLQSTPYDFIMSANKPSTGSGGFSVKHGPKLLYIIAAGAALVVVLFIVMALANLGKGDNTQYLAIAQDQTEMTRITTQYYGQLTDEDTKGFVANTWLSLASAQTDYLDFLSRNGVKISPKALGGSMNPQSDTQLTAAQTNGGLDTTLHDLLVTELQQYQGAIQSAYKNATSGATKAELQGLFDQAHLLLQQAGADQPATS